MTPEDRMKYFEDAMNRWKKTRPQLKQGSSPEVREHNIKVARERMAELKKDLQEAKEKYGLK